MANTPSADDAYTAAHAECLRLTERIQSLLFDLPAPGNEDHPIDWGHVGSLGEVKSRLAVIIAMMEGTER